MGRGIGSWFKKQADKAKQFLKKGSKTLLNAAKEQGTKFIQETAAPIAKEIAGNAVNKLKDGATQIIKENAGNLAQSIMQDPSAARELIKGSFKNATAQSKNLIKEAVSETKDAAMAKKGMVIDNAKRGLSDVLQSTQAAMVPQAAAQTGNGMMMRPINMKMPVKRTGRYIPLGAAMAVGNQPIQGQGVMPIGAQYRQRGFGVVPIGAGYGNGPSYGY